MRRFSKLYSKYWFIVFILSLALFSGVGLAEVEVTMSYAPHFKIYFNPELNAPMLGTEQSGDAIFDFVADVRSSLVNSYDNYAEVPGSTAKGFELPEDTDVYVDDWGPKKTAEWDWMSKDIEIPVTYSNLKELQYDAAHELFHAVQNQYINFVTMNSYRWWMEATADYAAAYIGTGHGLKSSLPHDFIIKPLNSEEEQHTYQVAHFIKFLADKGINFRDLFVATMESGDSVLEAINSHLNTQGYSLIELYGEFVIYFMQGLGVKRDKLENDIATDLATFSDLYKQGTDSVSTSVDVDKNYAASIAAYRIVGNQDTAFPVEILSIDGTPGIQTHYVIAGSDDEDDILRWGILDEAVPVKEMVKGGYYVYFVVTNADEKSGYTTVMINKAKGIKSVENKRKATLYNGEYSADVNFSLNCSQELNISSEVLRSGGEYYQLVLELVDGIPVGENVKISASTRVSNLALVENSPVYEPFFEEVFWRVDGEKVIGENIELVIKDSSGSYTRLTYVVHLKYRYTETGEEFLGRDIPVIDVIIDH